MATLLSLYKTSNDNDPILRNYSGIKEMINKFMTIIKFVSFEIDAKASKNYNGINIYKYPTVEFPNVTGRVPFEISQSACTTYIRKLGDNPYKYCAQRNEKQNNIVVAVLMECLNVHISIPRTHAKTILHFTNKYNNDTSHIVLGLLYNYAQDQRVAAQGQPLPTPPGTPQSPPGTPQSPPGGPPGTPQPQAPGTPAQGQPVAQGQQVAQVTPSEGRAEMQSTVGQPGSGQPGRRRLQYSDIDFNKKSMVLIEERPLFIRLVQNDVNFTSEPQKVIKEKVPISSGELYISQDNTQDKELKKINRKYNCWNFIYIILNSYPAIFGLHGYIIKYRNNTNKYGVNKNTIKVLLDSMKAQNISISLKIDIYDEKSNLLSEKMYIKKNTI